jgi:aconitate hydratase
VIVKSFARIHETNLKKQGMLAFTFVNPADYDLIRQDDTIDLVGFNEFAPAKNFKVVLKHADGSSDSFEVKHTYNQQQIDWIKSGSALNKIREELKS